MVGVKGFALEIHSGWLSLVWISISMVAVASAGARKGRLRSPEPVPKQETAELCCYRDKGSEQVQPRHGGWE